MLKVKDKDTDAPMRLSEVHQKARQEHGTPKSRSLPDTPSRDRRSVQSTPSSDKRRLGGQRSLGEIADDQPHARASPATSSQARASDSQSRPERGTWASKASPAPLPTPQTSSPDTRPRDKSSWKAAAQPPGRGEMLVLFKREIAQVIRQMGTGLDVATAAQRLRGCQLPAGRSLEEAVDLLARVVDEPRARRRQLFPLLSALVVSGVFSPPGVLGDAVSAFVEEAFADPHSVDPPDLGDIVLSEMLPALGLLPGNVRLPPCLRERKS